MNSASELYIGIMSGTSADAADAVLVDLSSDPGEVLGHSKQILPDSLKSDVIALSSRASDSLGKALELDYQLGQLFAQCVLDLLETTGRNAHEIAAIGCHGQTLRHRPPEPDQPPPHYSLQVGDPNIIAERTGIATVADFRRRDMAAGGQAAPLAPAFHAHWFGSEGEDRAVANLGGIANLTLLRGKSCQLGFDSGPANALMDYWVHKHLNRAFDEDGAWAACGQVSEPLLKTLLTHPFFEMLPPKSTGREDFNADWLESLLAGDERPEDVQATLLELTAASLAMAVDRHAGECGQLILCGGGAHNKELRNRLAVRLPDVRIETSLEHGLDPEQVEATAFAWLAKRRLHGEWGNSERVTGAAGPRILGGLYVGASDGE